MKVKYKFPMTIMDVIGILLTLSGLGLWIFDQQFILFTIVFVFFGVKLNIIHFKKIQKFYRDEPVIVIDKEGIIIDGHGYIPLLRIAEVKYLEESNVLTFTYFLSSNKEVIIRNYYDVKVVDIYMKLRQNLDEYNKNI